MSMISSLIDELRKSADGQVTYRDARVVMLEAADTIWQLRDDLQRANEAVRDAEHDESRAWDRVRKLKAENAKLRNEFDKMDKWHSAELTAAMDENAKLRELVRHMHTCMGNVDADGNHECFSCEYEGADCDYDYRMRDLGVEVDE